MREMMVRADRITDGVVGRMDSQARAMDKMAAELHELTEESRAQRAALLTILDRLQNGGASA